MKRKTFSLIGLALLPFAAAPQAMMAQSSGVYLEFSGGEGAPLTITFSEPLVFVVDTPPPGEGPAFVFQGVGNVLGPSISFTGNVLFSINDGPSHLVNRGGSGFPFFNDLVPDDLFLYSEPETGPFSLGDVITLSAGTLTSISAIADAAPANGFYDAFVADTNGRRVSQAPIPEPSTYALLAGVLCLGAAFLRRRFRS